MSEEDQEKEKKTFKDYSWKKGQSGNPNGRPKVGKLTGADKKELDALVRSGDIKEILAFMCARAHTVNDAFKYVKEFAPYLAPKLQTINSINKNDNTFTIEWKAQLYQKVEDIDAEYEKLTGKQKAIENAQDAEFSEEAKEIIPALEKKDLTKD